jgi:hypothetical protein
MVAVHPSYRNHRSIDRQNKGMFEVERTIRGETTMATAKYSRTDTKGKLYVDCSECERGVNGSDKDKCSCGWQVKRGRQGGCFLGTLRAGLTVRSATARPHAEARSADSVQADVGQEVLP